jgi:hypothetical protein
MAQHIPINNTTNKNMKKVFISISKQFNNFGVSKIKSSLKYQEIYDDVFKISKNDNVFKTWRTVVNGTREIFEVHFDSIQKKVIQIYFVK